MQTELTYKTWNRLSGTQAVVVGHVVLIADHGSERANKAAARRAWEDAQARSRLR